MTANYSRQSLITQLFANSKPVVQVFLIIIVTFSSFFVLSFLSIVFAIPIFGLSYDDINILLKGDLLIIDISLLKYFQFTQSVSLFIIPSLFLNLILFSKKDRLFSDKGRLSAGLLIMIAIVMLISSPIIDMLINLNEKLSFPEFMSSVEQKIRELENDGAIMTQRLLSGRSITDYVINIVMIAVIPALGEEFYFRGVLQPLFSKWFRSNHLGILAAAILFSAIHLQFYGFVPRLFLGLFFGYLLLWSKNIWLAVFAHFLNNSLAVSIDFYSRNFQSPFYEKITDPLADKTSTTTVSILFTSIFIYIIYRYTKTGEIGKEIIS